MGSGFPALRPLLIIPFQAINSITLAPSSHPEDVYQGTATTPQLLSAYADNYLRGNDHKERILILYNNRKHCSSL